MKLSKTFLILITLAIIASVGIVAAEDATVGPYTFEVPDGYTIATATDTTLAMQQDEYNAISFATEVSDDIESAKQGLIAQGHTFVEETPMEYNGYNTTLQSFTIDKDGTTLYSYNYIELIDEGNFVVTLVTDDPNFDADLNSGENPAATIFDTLVVN